MKSTDTNPIHSQEATTGPQGQKYLATGQNIAMRLWEEPSQSSEKDVVARDYETVGYVISGQAELTLDQEKIVLNSGDSWVVPKGVPHTYQVIESFVAIEATHPPARDL